MNLRKQCLWRDLIPLVSLVAVACGASTSLGAAIHYGDIIGEALLFQNVTETSTTDMSPLFGSPTISDGALSFHPVSFNANSTCGQPAVDTTTGDLSMGIVALGDRHINTITVKEAGDYVLAGVGTAAARVEASVMLAVSILEIDGVAITPVSFTQSMTFAPNTDGHFNQADDPGVGVLWNGLASIDVAAVLVDAGILGDATKVSLEVNNTLTTTAEPLTVAHIAEKQFGITVATETGDGLIPEPTSLSLIAFGLLGLLPFRKRKTQAHRGECTDTLVVTMHPRMGPPQKKQDKPGQNACESSGFGYHKPVILRELRSDGEERAFRRIGGLTPESDNLLASPSSQIGRNNNGFPYSNAFRR